MLLKLELCDLSVIATENYKCLSLLSIFHWEIIFERIKKDIKEP